MRPGKDFAAVSSASSTCAVLRSHSRLVRNGGVKV